MTCQKIDCPNTAVWYPTFLIYAPRETQSNVPITITLPVAICNEHQQTDTLKDFLSDAGWDQIANAIVAAGRVRPDRERTQLSWVKISQVNTHAGLPYVGGKLNG